MNSVVLFIFAAVMVAASVPGMVQPGTPDGVPASFDCAVRKFAYEYGKNTLPRHGEFRTLFEALQLEFCGMDVPSNYDVYEPPTYPSSTEAVYVSTAGNDANAGTIASPFATIRRAIAAVAEGTSKEIVIREGEYFLKDTVHIGPESSGLTIRNHAGEHVVVTGATSFMLPKTAWNPYKQMKTWDRLNNANVVFGDAVSGRDTTNVKYLGTYNSTEECVAALNADTDSKGPFHAFTHHQKDFDAGTFAGQCFGRTDDAYQVHAQAKVNSGYFKVQNVWRADVSFLGLKEMPGLRRNGHRVIRAKYPNGDPEQSGGFLKGADAGMGGGDYYKGWMPLSANTEWIKPARKADSEELVVTAADWPSVEWPMSEDGGSQWTGEGDWGEYHLGFGGYCDDLSPPVGYWCSMNPPRGQCWDKAKNEGSGCTQTHMSPDGMVLERALNYSDPTTAIIQSWRGGGRWFTQQWRVQSFDRSTATLHFDPATGHQSGEGMTSAGQWWIENVKEEVDSANEWFFDEKEQMLYFNPNTTDGQSGPSGEEKWSVPLTRVLFNISGTQENPVRDVAIKGLTLRDTRYTYFDKRGMPSGGDWTLQRSAAIVFEGTERCQLTDSLITNVDGNGFGLNGYNRNTTIAGNDFEWIGDGAMYAWGYTGYCLNENCSRKLPYKVGPDGRKGEQPRGTLVTRNLVREIGIWQKQSSMWFQAVTAETVFEHNVHFNGPRAGININDGFGGGDIFRHNLLTNCVRESGDHGPVNSWDRVPYITDISGRPSIVPKWREFAHNFFIGVYSTQQAIDNDDGSAFWSSHDNFFVYGANGVKSDFGGQYNHHVSNVYAYVGNCWGGFGTDGSGAHNQFVNNKCIANSENGGFISDCKKIWFGQEVIGNSAYNKDGKLQSEFCDPSNTIAVWPNDDEIMSMARVALSTERELLAKERVITVKADGTTWRANDEGNNLVSSSRGAKDDYSVFILEMKEDGSYRIRVKADGKYLHVDGLGDQLLSTRYQSNDDYTRFLLDGPDAEGFWRLKVKATGKYLHAADNDSRDVGTNHQTIDDYSKFSFKDLAELLAIVV